MIKAIFFDLDGTLLPMDENAFVKYYFSLLCKKAAPFGYSAEEFVKVIWAGTKQMVLNDGSKTNEEIFWDYFAEYYGKEKLKDKAVFDDFYRNEFLGSKAACGENPLAQDIVAFAREHFERVVLATNPVFPREGTINRMGFVGLKEEDFDFITTYETARHSKPNPAYFKDLLERFGLKGEEVLLFGNNESEDGEAAYANGIKCYMVGDFVIANPKAEREYEHISIEEIIPVMKKYL